MHLNSWFALSVMMAVLTISVSCQGSEAKRDARTSSTKVPDIDDQANQGETDSTVGDDDDNEESDDEYELNNATYYQDVKQVLEQRCGSCHVAQEQAPLLSTYMQSYLARDEIRVSVREGRMPPGSPLSLEEKKLVIGWIKAGAQQGVQLEFTNFGNDVMVAAHDFAEIDVRIDASSQANWSLYWTKDPNDTKSGTLAVAPQSVTNKTALWQVSELEAGDYYIYAKVQADQREFVFKAPQKVRLGQPSIRLVSEWRKGRVGFLNPAQLSYSVGNTSGVGALSVRVEYKNGANNITYTKLTDAAGLTEYTLPTLPEGDDYYFRVSLLQDGDVIAVSETEDLISFADQYYLIGSLEGNCMEFNCHPSHGTLENNLRVLDRIKDAAAPMPPNGVLSSADQLKLRLWFWQNYNK